MRARVVVFVLSLSAHAGGDAATGPHDAVPQAPIVAEGGRSIGAFGMECMTFTSHADGVLDASVDWAGPENDVDVYLVSGNCVETRLSAGDCPMLAFSESMSAKPERLALELPAGVYTLGALSQNPRPERLRWRVTTR